MVDVTYELPRNDSPRALFKSLVLDLIGQGPESPGSQAEKFQMVSPGTQGELDTVNFALLRATNLIDPLISISPNSSDLIWGISVYIQGDQVLMSWGRMRHDGQQVPEDDQAELHVAQSPPSVLGNIAELTAPGDPNDDIDTVRTDAIGPSALHGYRLTLTDRGFALAVYHQNKIKDWTQFSAVLLQRPVKSDGTVLTDGKAPLFVVWNNLDFGEEGNTNSIGGPDDLSPRWYKSILWENDTGYSTGSLVFNPTIYQGSSAPDFQVDKRPDEFRQIQFEGPNTLYGFPTHWDQPLTQDNNEVPLVFPFGLTTNRFSYLEEMDLLCVGPSCVFTFGQIIDLVVFGEARQYQILSTSDPCQGVVPAILVNGPNFI